MFVYQRVTDGQVLRTDMAKNSMSGTRKTQFAVKFPHGKYQVLLVTGRPFFLNLFPHPSWHGKPFFGP